MDSTVTLSKEEQEYVKSLTNEESKTLEIARDHLESSFNMRKSIGFIKWKENKGNKEKST
jgi:hypothetical protein|tara:strand:+ start:1533 stop:1712 length:180 start_codon:yes stop_codon:yes gene_type:complete